MEKVLSLQNWILQSSPGLIPLLALFYSALTSFHCTLMCSSFVPESKNRNLFFVGRAFGYTLIGAFFGSFGNWLKEKIEFQLLGVFAFILFAIFTLTVAGVSFLPAHWRFYLRPRFSEKILSSGHWMRGVLFSAIPCHRLAFFYSLAILAANTTGGALVLLGHALASTPALAYGPEILRRLSSHFPQGPKILKILLLLVLFLNLAFFASQLFMSSEESLTKILFCF